MSHDESYVDVPKRIQENAKESYEDYLKNYQQSIQNSEKFWEEQAKRITWFKSPTKIKNTRFDQDVLIKWYEDGVLNACYNAVDRHLPEKADKVALIFEADTPGEVKNVTYQELHDHVVRLANIFKSHGIKKGDRVIIYMPMICESVYAMLACARIGAIHSVVFGGFSPHALQSRIIDAKAAYIITADEGYRGGKTVPLKKNVDEALDGISIVSTVFVVKHTHAQIDWVDGRDIDVLHEMSLAQAECACEEMNAEDPLFILYTSGSTGTPKGVLHTTGGYLVYASLTHDVVFDVQEEDVYWCTADVGWITGHSYVTYGPLLNGATQVIFEGIPTYPDASRFWQIIDRHQVSLFYTAPTAIRGLMRLGDEMLDGSSRDSLRVLGSVGEPINPEAWRWYFDKVGKKRCAIVDTWWQTETGGIMMTPLPGFKCVKPGYAMKPFYGVKPVIMDEQGHEMTGEAEGAFCLSESWPGQMRTVYGDHDRFVKTYFSAYKNVYFTGDGVVRDKDGDYRITGRMDDVLNVSGHRFGTAEIESALVEHAAVTEAAVVGRPHDLKGQGIYVYVTLRPSINPSEELKKELVALVRQEIGPIAIVDWIQWAPALPKTRSGKIMRRVLRKIACQEADQLGDLSTLADPAVVDDLIKNSL